MQLTPETPFEHLTIPFSFYFEAKHSSTPIGLSMDPWPGVFSESHSFANLVSYNFKERIYQIVHQEIAEKDQGTFKVSGNLELISFPFDDSSDDATVVEKSYLDLAMRIHSLHVTKSKSSVQKFKTTQDPGQTKQSTILFKDLDKAVQVQSEQMILESFTQKP